MPTETINYQVGDERFYSYLAYPDQGKKLPVVIVLHELWGLNDYARHRADMIAELGYIAMAPDMYGNATVADNLDRAKQLMNDLKSNIDVSLELLRATLDQLRQVPQADMSKLAAIGYCMGGTMALNMARAGFDLAGVASFHADLNTPIPANPGDIKAKIKVFHGNDDVSCPADVVAEFKREMAFSGADYEFIGYDNAEHGFTNPAADEKAAKFKMPVAYNREADQDSWQRLTVFLKELFTPT